MDPSKLQKDSNNDVNSLEGTGTIVEDDKQSDDAKKDGESNVTDASGGKVKSDSAKPPVLKRLWQKFNIYLLLFGLVVIVAVSLAGVMYLKDRKDAENAKDVINTQDLSAESLKQLANSNVTVGSAKQILNIESNSIFSGSVLVRSNLEVAGDMKLGGELQLPGITVSGASRFGELQADSLDIGADATVQGTFSVKNGLSVAGSSVFSGPISAPQVSTNSLQINGDLVLNNHIVAGGPIPGSSRGGALGSGGTASVSGSDTSGSITINTGGSPAAGCFITVSFVKKFSGVPHVIITPIGSGASAVNYYVNRSPTEFSVCTTNSAPGGQSFGFDYLVLG
jgi:cytoskeletal protein CcmA (bactofilin family)